MALVLPTSLTPETEESVNVQIDRNYFAHWEDVEITLAIDAFSTAKFTAPFALENRKFRDVFRPFMFQALEVDTHLETLFKGYILPVEPDDDATKTQVTIAGYARAAVLCDCSLPPVHPLTNVKVPREFKKLGISAIAASCCDPFGIKVALLADEGKAFDKVKCGPEKKVHEFLCELTKQRSLVIGNDTEGDVLLWQSVEPGNPVAHFVQGELPVPTIKAQFDPQNYFSHITGYAAKKRGKAPAQWTEQNPFLQAPYRPHTFKLEDTERADAPEATKAKAARMFANIVTYTIPDIPTWRDPSGQVWKPNTTITAHYPNAMIYEKTELLVRTVKLKTNKTQHTATLECCLPGAFNGKMPETLPWLES